MATNRPSSSGGVIVGASARAGKTKVKVDPKLHAAIAATGADQPVRVMVKLKSNKLSYGKLPPSNAPGNPRLEEFKRVVDDVVRNAARQTSETAKIVSSAANLGVATLEAPRTILQNLMQEDRLQGMKFVRIV